MGLSLAKVQHLPLPSPVVACRYLVTDSIHANSPPLARRSPWATLSIYPRRILA